MAAGNSRTSFACLKICKYGQSYSPLVMRDTVSEYSSLSLAFHSYWQNSLRHAYPHIYHKQTSNKKKYLAKRPLTAAILLQQNHLKAIPARLLRIDLQHDVREGLMQCLADGISTAPIDSSAFTGGSQKRKAWPIKNICFSWTAGKLGTINWKSVFEPKQGTAGFPDRNNFPTTCSKAI